MWGDFCRARSLWNGPSASFDCFGELLVRLGMLDAPPAQKCDQVFSTLLPGVAWNNSSHGPPRLDQKRNLTSRMDALHQARKTTNGIFNR